MMMDPHHTNTEEAIAGGNLRTNKYGIMFKCIKSKIAISSVGIYSESTGLYVEARSPHLGAPASLSGNQASNGILTPLQWPPPILICHPVPREARQIEHFA